MKFSLASTLCLIFLFCLSDGLHAQDDQSTQRKFRALAWGPPIQTLYYTQSEVTLPDADNPNPTQSPDYKETLLFIPAAFRSPFYDFDRSKPLKIVRHDGTKIVVVSSVDFSSGPKIPLLFVIPGASNTYTVKVIDDDADAFPGGSFLCFNFSNYVVKPAFTNSTGKSDLTLQPQEEKLVRPSFVDQKVTAVTVTLPTSNSRLVYSSNWVLRNDLRYLIFFLNDPANPTSVHFLRVSDQIEQLAEALPKPPE